jgi:hypothetical protein
MLAREHSTAGWDGGEAEPISQIAMNRAEDFIRALPADVAAPEFAPEPDGAISLDWIYSRNEFLSVSIGESDRLSFAWVDGSDTGYGVCHFDGKKVPRRILDSLPTALKNGDASLRAA